MRLDRYIGDEPKFKVLRRQPDGSYAEVPAFDYFVLKLSDLYALSALVGYGNAAYCANDHETAKDVLRLADEVRERPNRKRPD